MGIGVLALCGSVRPESSNQALLNAVRRLGGDFAWESFKIETLPYFDPQLQFADTPTSVEKLRALAKDADVILISTPEYAHGIPGVLKNALEWLICEQTMAKHVAVLIAAPSGGEFVQTALRETLTTMDLQVTGVQVVRDARKKIAADGSIEDAELKAVLVKFISDSLCGVPR